MTSLKNLLASNIRFHRKKLGITQEKLAERVDTSAHYIAMLESGRKSASIDMMERLAAALDIDAPELFSMREYPSQSLKKLQKSVLKDAQKAVLSVFSRHLQSLEAGDV